MRELGDPGRELQPLAGEPGQRRGEVQRRVDAVDVHVGDAGIDVPGAPAHLVEALGLERRLGNGPADDRVQPDVRARVPS